MPALKFHSGRSGYVQIVRHVMREGKRRAPRGKMTYDLENVMLEFETPFDAFPLSCGRNLSTRVAASEAIQLIGGFHDPRLMTWASPNFAQFAEPSGWFWGAYGMRVHSQVKEVIHKLRTDRDTRQAVITLWNPELDNQPGHKDYPCTVSLMFAIREQRLHMTAVMRSNDVWLGLPYDLFQFTQLQLSVAQAIFREPGTYTHFTHSLHLYRENMDSVEQLEEPKFADKASTKQLNGISCADAIRASVTGDMSIDLDFRTRAREIVYGVNPEKLTNLTPSEVWYVEQFADYPGRSAKPTYMGDGVDDGRKDYGTAIEMCA